MRRLGDETPASVGLGERQVSSDPNCQLVAYGLGSCVGLVMWGRRGLRRVMAMAHVVMPDSHGHAGVRAKFADTAVADLVEALTGAGCLRSSLQAVIGGGASMFPGSPLDDIGAANVARIRQELHRLHIPLRAAAVGGSRGRTVRAWVGEGRVVASTVGTGEVELWRDDPIRVPGGDRC